MVGGNLILGELEYEVVEVVVVRAAKVLASHDPGHFIFFGQLNRRSNRSRNEEEHIVLVLIDVILEAHHHRAFVAVEHSSHFAFVGTFQTGIPSVTDLRSPPVLVVQDGFITCAISHDFLVFVHVLDGIEEAIALGLSICTFSLSD